MAFVDETAKVLVNRGIGTLWRGACRLAASAESVEAVIRRNATLLVFARRRSDDNGVRHCAVDDKRGRASARIAACIAIRPALDREADAADLPVAKPLRLGSRRQRRQLAGGESERNRDTPAAARRIVGLAFAALGLEAGRLCNRHRCGRKPDATSRRTGEPGGYAAGGHLAGDGHRTRSKDADAA